jgi:hypothetical protein
LTTILVPPEVPLDVLPDVEKIKNKMKFVRGGGTQKTHKGRHSHGHHGSGCNHKSILGVDKMTKQERALFIERQAGRLGALVE